MRKFLQRLYAGSMGKTGELALIEHLRGRTARGGGALRLGIGDDCAVLRPPVGHDVLVTTDFSLEGVHFRRDWHAAQSAGHRCLARGLSDLAAMGARPMGAFLSLALPAGFTRRVAGRRWVEGFFTGLLALGKVTRAPLAGGDTATAPGDAILADIVLLGSVPRGTELRRSGARPGDEMYITGALGGAAAELALLSAKPTAFGRAQAGPGHPHLFPCPRLQAGDRIRRAGVATAAIDISDGLSTDLRHLCEESGVGAVIDAEQIPLHALLAREAPERALQIALHGGEDYELLFTAQPGARVARRIGGVAITRIGTVTRRRNIVLQTGGNTEPLIARGWEHAL